MRSIKIKIAASVLIVAMIVTAIPLVGLTESSADNEQGLVLDFGYWDTEWIEMTFTEGMNGNDLLDLACELRGYDVIRLLDGSVYSVNGQENLVGVHWAMYVLSDGEWIESDPASTNVSDYDFITWARSSGADSLISGTDYSGFSYYGYADDGVSSSTGDTLRIVTLAPSVTEIVVSVGGLEMIVGTDLYSNYPEDIVEGHNDGSIAITGGYTDPNYEWIIKLAPDIVFCDGSVGQQVTIADKLRKSGIDCVVLYDTTDISTLYDNTWIAASALGLSDNANSVINSLRTTIDAVSGIAGDTNKRVFVALSADPSPWTSGSNTFISDIISSVGGINVFDSQSSSWFMVSKEQIYAKQPQVIIIISSTEITTDEAYQEILDGLDPLWKETPAYKNGEVYVFSGAAADLLQRPGPRLSEAAELIAKILNAEAFESLDPLDSIPKYFGDDYSQYLKYQSEAF
jgi:iron complex transport system substrate-binding protein